MNLADFLINQTVSLCAKYAAHNEINFDPGKAAAYMKDTAKTRFKEIIDETKKDAKRADLFNNIPNGKLDPLTMTAGTISLTHGLTMYAKEIVENSKI